MHNNFWSMKIDKLIFIGNKVYISHLNNGEISSKCYLFIKLLFL